MIFDSISFGTRSAWCVFLIVVNVCIGLLVCFPALGEISEEIATRALNRSPQKTLFVECRENEKPMDVVSPVSLSEDEKWRAYVEVNVRSDLGCQNTTRLWVGPASGPYRLVYLMPPKRYVAGNGMEILGWARNSRMLLVKTELWQYESDAPDTQQVLAIDAATGVVYEPELEEMLQDRANKRCMFRVIDAGFNFGANVNILVRAKFFTAVEPDETEEAVPAAKRCGNTEETWSFDYATGQIKQVHTDRLQLFRKFVPNRRTKP
jgi:hypothetical protein